MCMCTALIVMTLMSCMMCSAVNTQEVTDDSSLPVPVRYLSQTRAQFPDMLYRVVGMASERNTRLLRTLDISSNV